MKNIKIFMITIFSLLAFSPIAFADGDDLSEEGEEEIVRIETAEVTNSNEMIVEGIVSKELLDQHPDAKLALYELATYENNEHISDHSPLSTMDVSENFSFEIDLMDGERSRLYSKFVIALNHEEEDIIISDGHYITNPEVVAESHFPFPEAKSKKGLQVKGDMTGDAEELGISHAALNFPYDEMLYKDEESSEEDNTLS